ncbi:melatonin receptor [Branchiostoma belcheri]|nr:melatonin receptor [Branchiostoma belcheri]
MDPVADTEDTESSEEPFQDPPRFVTMSLKKHNKVQPDITIPVEPSLTKQSSTGLSESEPQTQGLFREAIPPLEIADIPTFVRPTQVQQRSIGENYKSFSNAKDRVIQKTGKVLSTLFSLFLMNFIYAIINAYGDLENDPPDLFAKTATAFAVLELVIIVVTYGLEIGQSRGKCQSERRLNKLAGGRGDWEIIKTFFLEFLLYPIVIVDLYEFVVEEQYLMQSLDSILGAILFLLFVLELTQTYVVRIYVLLCVKQTIQKEFESTNAKRTCNGHCYSWWSGDVLASLIGQQLQNMLLFVLIMAQLGYVIHMENRQHQDYTVTLWSGVIIAAGMMFPVFQNLIFLLTNKMWIYETIYQVLYDTERQDQPDSDNSATQRDSDKCQRKLREYKSMWKEISNQTWQQNVWAGIWNGPTGVAVVIWAAMQYPLAGKGPCATQDGGSDKKNGPKPPSHIHDLPTTLPPNTSQPVREQSDQI